MTGDSKPLILQTLHAAASQMQLRPRTLAKAARKVGACSIFWHTILLSDDDIRAVYEANRAEASQSFLGSQAGVLESRIYDELRALTSRPKKSKLKSQK